MLVSIPRRGQVLSLLIREQEAICADLKRTCEPIIERGLEVGAARSEERDAVRLRFRFLQFAGALTASEAADYDAYLALPEFPNLSGLVAAVRASNWSGKEILRRES